MLPWECDCGCDFETGWTGERLHPSQDVSLFLWREEVVERYLYFSLSPFFFLFLTTLRGGGCGIAGPSRDTCRGGLEVLVTYGPGTFAPHRRDTR